MHRNCQTKASDPWPIAALPSAIYELGSEMIPGDKRTRIASFSSPGRVLPLLPSACYLSSLPMDLILGAGD